MKVFRHDALRAIVAAGIFFFAAQPAAAQGHGAVATIRAVRVAEAPRLDGRLDDAAWRDATPATEFLQRDPDEGKPPTERTELFVVYDGSALYVGVRLHDREPNKIVRRLSRRDDRADADRFTIYLDPHHDHLTGAVFSVSAAGSLSDAVLFNDTWQDSSWDAVWEAAVSIDSQGWTAEMRIPFAASVSVLRPRRLGHQRRAVYPAPQRERLAGARRRKKAATPRGWGTW